MALKYFHYIFISIFNRNQAKQALQRHPVCIDESDHNYILEKLNVDKMNYKRNISGNGDEE